MCCTNGLISRSGPRFSHLPLPPHTISTTLTPNPLPFQINLTHFPNARVSLQNGRLRSFKPKATINDGFVASLPPLNHELSFYELLGIPETVTLVEIKQAYKQLARRYHPDVSPPDRVDEYTQRFIRVQEAYETLSDPSRRALYDKDMAMGLHLAFSARNRYRNDEQMEEKSKWKSCWQDQLSGLKRRSMYKDTSERKSWGARMHQQRNEPST